MLMCSGFVVEKFLLICCSSMMDSGENLFYHVCGFFLPAGVFRMLTGPAIFIITSTDVNN